jgi:ABC-2 type transport system permease protein
MKIEKQKRSPAAHRPPTHPEILRKQRRSLIKVLLALVLLIGGNYIFKAVAGRYNHIDLTAAQVMTTGEVTRTLLRNLSTSVEIIILDDPAEFAYYNQFMVPLLDEYETFGNGRLTVSYKDPNDHPAALKELDPDDYYHLSERQLIIRNPANGRMRILEQSDLLQTAYDQSTGQWKQTGYKAEAALSGAIRYVTAEIVPTVYLSTGHGEAELDQNYNALKRLLINNQFRIAELGAPGSGDIPEDADAVMILAPEKDFFPVEIDTYMKYIKRGGSLLIASDFNRVDYTNLNQILDAFNLQISTDRIAEQNDQLTFNHDPYGIMAQVPASRISPQEFKNSTLMPNSRAIRTGESPAEWIGTEALVTTDAQGIAEAGGAREQQSPPGMQTLAMLSENSGFITDEQTPSAKAVVFGSASAFSDDVFRALGDSGYNYSLLFNAVNWLTNQGQTSGKLLILEKPLTDYRLKTLSNSGITLATLLSAVLLPTTFFLIAFIIYRKRKYL